jgi:hypothetical protein
MGIFDRLGNLVKGTVAVARSGDDPVERAAREQALRDELARITPSPAAHAELDRRKSGAPAAASSPAGTTAPADSTDPLAVELARLQKAYDEGVLTRAEVERKRAEAVARHDGMPDDPDGSPAIQRTL